MNGCVTLAKVARLTHLGSEVCIAAVNRIARADGPPESH
jgi:hypothetical protein